MRWQTRAAVWLTRSYHRAVRAHPDGRGRYGYLVRAVGFPGRACLGWARCLQPIMGGLLGRNLLACILQRAALSQPGFP